MDLPKFSRKIVTIETTEELIQFIGFISSVHWEIFLCVTVYRTAHQRHTTPHASLIIVREMTFYFLFKLLLLFPNFLFQFLLYRPKFLLIILWNESFFLCVILLILLVIQGLLFGNIFTAFCGIARSTQNSTHPHTDSVNSLILLAESTNTSQSVQSRDPLRF